MQKHYRPRIAELEWLESRRLLSTSVSQAYWAEFGGDAQHTAISSAATQPLQAVHWKTPVDLDPQYSGTDLLAHYGSPVITAKNTVIVPVKTGTTGNFQVEAFNGATGKLKWTVKSDYVPPSGLSFAASFAPALTSTGRLYMPGAGGTLIYLDNVDANTAPTIHHVAFYGLANYVAHAAAFNASVIIDTPMTISKADVIYFGYEVLPFTSNPLNLKGGLARVTLSGQGTFVFAATATSNASTVKVAQNCAPAISTGGHWLYVAMNQDPNAFTDSPNYLVCLNTTTLKTISKVALIDPGTGNYATLDDQSSACPTVGPDNDVYFGVLDNPFASNNARGWLLHFGPELATKKTPALFGWDDTASIVPASMVPQYHGKSSYLLLTMYNNYAGYGSGNGINKMAVLDPNATEFGKQSGINVMKEIETVTGVTPDPANDTAFPGAVKEWCVNTVAIDPKTDSALFNSEDGQLFRWNLGKDKLTEIIRLTPGLGEAYTPTSTGPDGTVYAIQDAVLYAVGKKG